MERADLELVVALDAAGTLSGAARQLHTAQPALSRRLAALERQVGGRLYERDRHGTVPTPAGRVLAEGARRALAAIATAEDDVAAAVAGRHGVLRIGTAPTLGAELLPAALARHRAEHPDVQLELAVSGDSPALQARVADGELDLAVVVLGKHTAPGLRVATSAPQAMVLALPHDHPLAARRRVPREELPSLRLLAVHRGEGMRTLLDEVFEDLGATPDIAIELSERELLMPFVAAGLGATVLPERFARQRAPEAVALRPLSPPLTRSVGAVVRSGPLPALVAAFAATLAHTWPTE